VLCGPTKDPISLEPWKLPNAINLYVYKPSYDALQNYTAQAETIFTEVFASKVFVWMWNAFAFAFVLSIYLLINEYIQLKKRERINKSCG